MIYPLTKETLKLLFCVLVLLDGFGLSAQNLTGTWTGDVVQKNSKDVYRYELQLTQDKSALSGRATSTAPTGQSATFLVSGVINGNKITLQEVKQTKPKSPKWCMKFMTLQLNSNKQIGGKWRADGCANGTLELSRKQSSASVTHATMPWVGQWVGSLDQSDRGYGFYFEMNLNADNTGTSYIVSEGNGGSATHQLTWQYDKDKDQLYFEESHIANKSMEAWKWCIKQATLDFVDLGSSYFMMGDWSGYIEKNNTKKGACAPGKITLEKPIVEKISKTVIEENKTPYEAEQHRTVKIGRTLTVKSNKLKIRVWDNGTVDGDIATIFLNGNEIFSDYKVSKHKRGVPVTIKEKDNILILHAEDLGDISPNTVAVSIDDGEREQIVIVSSNLEDSGAILIRQFDKE